MRRAWVFVIELVFPAECLGCGCEGEIICRECLAKIPREEGCSLEREGRLDAIVAATRYDNRLVKEAIQLLKYHYVRGIAEPLGEVLRWALRRLDREIVDFDKERAVLVPVPISKRRQRLRGYNQAALLCGVVSKETGIPYLELLEKRVETKSQALLNKKERLANLRGVFACKDKEGVEGLQVVIVDDVTTTGSTLLECARVIEKAGAEKVFAITVAKEL
jgi:ComF family protein